MLVPSLCLAARGSRLALSLALVALAADAQAPSNGFVAEKAIAAIPLDLEVSPNGAIAVVRGNDTVVVAPANPSNARVSFWTTSPAVSQQLFPAGPVLVGRGNLNQVGNLTNVSDAVAVTNDRAIAIGSAISGGATENVTYVDIVAIDNAADPPGLAVLATHAFGPGSGATTARGLAHDVAITPDGARAVVSHRNYISVFDMLTGRHVKSLNIGSATPIPADGIAGNGACDPGTSRNSVVVTNGRAVVTARRFEHQTGANLYFRTWVYVVDISGQSPRVLLEHQLAPLTGQDVDQGPHDLALTPDGSLAMVTASDAVGLIDLSTPAVVGELNSTLLTRSSTLVGAQLWDSVELTNDRAVVLANLAGASGYYWYSEVYQISPSALTLKATFSGQDPTWSGDPGWDLALSSDGQVAAIKAHLHDVAILDVNAATPGSLWRAGPGSTTNPVYSGGVADFMNDAVAITQSYVEHLPPGSGGDSPHRWVAFAGVAGNPLESRVYFYDLAQATFPYVPFHITGPNLLVRVADLELSASRTQVVARMTAPPDEQNPELGGRDWYRFVSRPPALVGSGLGGKGVCVGRDDLRESRSKVVSISWDSSWPTPAGFIHIVDALN